ncbi:MAG: translation initiation factor IF-2 [Thermoanaerobaculaceae bacterium]|nr:translation initiation factor IF-2 [Thermoanaerobaculaceae bacterium]MDI9620917.1 translation initiation factor IF-2 [Acidobacteriota bacterium]NLH12417.1 translation initiation factor IF-2 [Holophagae bacterium]HPW56803.1 translation initiation factor IF-2 [Thermoanaerobaculaceae bacterium]
MAQVFRVGDLARQMGVTVEELLFKLRSIGVDVQNADSGLDLATVRAIITGETLQKRRGEVIVRAQAPAPEEARRPTPAPMDRLKKKRPGRRIGLDEELPDAVPNLAALSVPASPRPPARVTERGPVPVQAEEGAEGRESEAVVTGAEEPVISELAEPSAAVEPEVTVAVEPADLGPLAESSRAEEHAEHVQAEEVPEPTPAVQPEAEEPTVEVTAETEPSPVAATAVEPAKPHAKPHGPRKAAARTPLESQLRELSDEEVRQRILAAKKAPAAAATAAKPSDRPAVPGRGKASKKAKAAADADEIRDLLAKFEESKVRAKADAPAAVSAPVAPAGRGRPTHRTKRDRAEMSSETRSVSVSFRDGAKPQGPIYLSEAVTVRELAEKLNVLVKDLMAYLIFKRILVTANQALPQELAEQICDDLGVEAMVVSFEEEIDLQQEETAVSTSKPEPRPPVVTVMGHVDHGKTSLLDAIRSTRVAAGEAGGITQHIGASRVVHNHKPIVFIDTPGHEAFTQMRARGAKVTDIVVLVVAADDGVMPQTLEAINHANAAHVPIVVAINKIDKPSANPERIKQELAGRGVLLEGWGGEVPVALVSATKKQGIDELLEVILLVAEMSDLKAVREGMARGTVLEARKERGRGVVATVLVQQGTLKQGDCFFAGATYGRVRAMLDTNRKPARIAKPSDAVEIMGLEDMPEAGDIFQVVENEARAREVAGHRQAKQREEQMAGSRKVSLEGLMDKIKADEVKALNLVLKADVQGSAEVLRDTLAKLSTSEVAVNVLHASVGAITANDILLASASQAIVIGFNVRPERSAKELAEREGVDVRLYSVIYAVTEEIQKAMTGMLAPTIKEEELGRAEVREVFRVSKVGTVAGCMVLEGSILRNARARLLRDNVVVWEGNLASLRRFKDDVGEVKSGFDCGIGLERFQDIKEGDIIEAFRLVEVARLA